MLAAVKFLREIASQEPLKSLMAEELRPGPACHVGRGADP
jgi:choline dehydrogenase